MIDRPACPLCGRRTLWIMRAAGCCLGPIRRVARIAETRRVAPRRPTTDLGCLSNAEIDRLPDA